MYDLCLSNSVTQEVKTTVQYHTILLVKIQYHTIIFSYIKIIAQEMMQSSCHPGMVYNSTTKSGVIKSLIDRYIKYTTDVRAATNIWL